MPGISAILNLTSVPIITVDPTLQTGPTWSPIGQSSGACYGLGCGYTGWVNSTYAIQNAGTYVLLFGVTNWADPAFDSGLAFSGLTIGSTPIEGEDDIGETPFLPPSHFSPPGLARWVFLRGGGNGRMQLLSQPNPCI